jgi:NTE family protein
VNLGVASKMNGEIAFLEYLKNVGRARADTWLTANFEAIGSRSTIDLDATLGGMEITQNR